MTLLRLPSVSLDAVTEDALDATSGSVTSADGPFLVSDGHVLELTIDGGSPQQFTLNEVDFADIAAATAAEIANVVGGSLVGATITVDDDAFVVTTDTFGGSGSVNVTAGGAPFGLSPGASSGTYASDQLVLVNRQPEPGETSVDPTTDIAVEIYRYGNTAPALADVTVEVDGANALVLGVAEPGWSVSSTAPDAATRRLVLSHVDDLVHADVTSVRVRVPSFAGFTQRYEFSTIDDVAPEPLQVLATGRRVVRLQFTEPVRMVSVTGSSDALNPTNYEIERVSKPTVQVVISEVTLVSETEVDIHLVDDMTFLAEYRLYVYSVVDLAGNPVALPPANAIGFTGYAPPFPPGRRWSLREFLPQSNFSEDSTGELAAFVACLQEVANVLLCDVDEWSRLIDPETAPDAVVAAILGDLGDPFPTLDLGVTDQRRLAVLLVALYKLRGTERGIIDALRFFTGIEFTLDVFNGTGWELTDTDHPDDGDELGDDDSDGDPQAVLGPDQAGLYSFRVISPVDLSEDVLRVVVTVVEAMRVAHEHLVAVVEPSDTVLIDHVELGLSELGDSGGPGSWILH